MITRVSSSNKALYLSGWVFIMKKSTLPDYTYNLFYKDENDKLQTVPLGKELNQAALTKAQNVINQVEGKKAAKKNDTTK